MEDLCKSEQEQLEYIKNKVAKIPDFPRKGILFYDIFSLLKDSDLQQKTFEIALKYVNNFTISNEVNAIIGLESRGFLLGLIIADRMKLPFIPARKKNKLPGSTLKIKYTTEYSEDVMEIQSDALNKNSKVLIVDDLLATGGTMKASEDLVRLCDAHISGYFVLFEIEALKGRQLLTHPDKLISLITI